MSAPNLAWGGYKNGQIPTEVLVDIGGGKLLHPAAASRLAALAAAFAKAFPGSRLYVAKGQDTYRDLAYQQAKSGTGNHNYAPGHSIHGWARSADLSGYGASSDSTTARHKWLQANAPKYGWSWAYGKELGEAWHFDYIGSLIVGGGLSGGGSQQEVEDMARIEFVKAKGDPVIWLSIDCLWRRPMKDVRDFTDTAALLGVPAEYHEFEWLTSFGTPVGANAAVDPAAIAAAVDQVLADDFAGLKAVVAGIEAGTIDTRPILDALNKLPAAVREELAAGLVSAAP